MEATAIVDKEIFSQILDMDEGNDRKFSRELVFDYFEQAASTFHDMEDACENNNLPKLSSLGHYLKGSSAALGFTKVSICCQNIQHFGARKDENGMEVAHGDDYYLGLIRTTISNVKEQNKAAQNYLESVYGFTF